MFTYCLLLFVSVCLVEYVSASLCVLLFVSCLLSSVISSYVFAISDFPPTLNILKVVLYNWLFSLSPVIFDEGPTFEFERHVWMITYSANTCIHDSFVSYTNLTLET